MEKEIVEAVIKTGETISESAKTITQKTTEIGEGLLNSEATQKMLSKFAILAAKMGVGAEYLFGLTVKQMYVDCIWYFGMMAFMCLMCYIWTKISTFINNKQENTNWNNECRMILSVVGWILVPLGTIITFFACSYKAIACLVNPEFMAFKYLLELIK